MNKHIFPGILAVLMFSILIGCQSTQEATKQKKSLAQTLISMNLIWVKVFSASKIENEMHDNQTYTVFIPPDETILDSIKSNPVSFGNSVAGEKYIRDYIVTPEVNINISNTYRTLSGKIVIIAKDNSPCRMTVNNIPLAYCADDPETSIQNGSYFLIARDLYSKNNTP